LAWRLNPWSCTTRSPTISGRPHGARALKCLEDAGLGDLKHVGDLVGLEVRQGAEDGLVVAASDVDAVQGDHV